MKMDSAVLAVLLLTTLTPVAQSAISTQDSTQDATQNATLMDSKSPMEKVLEMLSDYRMKVVDEEKEAYILYSEYTALCDKKHQATSFLILKEEQKIDEFRAALNNELATIATMASQISDLTTSIAVTTRKLKAERAERKADSDLYIKEVKELEGTIADIKSAIRALESSKGASLMQSNKTNNLVETLGAMVKASMLSFSDSQRLTALVQESQKNDNDDSDDALGAPTTIYEKKSGSVIEILSGLQDTAEAQLDAAEKAELKNSGDFQSMEKQLQLSLDKDKETLAKIRGEQPDHEQLKAYDEGELVQVKNMLTIDQKTLKMSDDDCKKAAVAFTGESKGREEEVVVLSKAIDAIKESTGAKTTHQFDFKMRNAASLLQVKFNSQLKNAVSFMQHKIQSNGKSDGQSSAMNRYFEALHLVRDLGDQQNASDLKLLAMRMSNAVKANHKSADPFAKVKDLITGMIAKLEDQASNELDKHTFCSKEMSKAEAAVREKTADLLKKQAAVDAAEAADGKVSRELQEIAKSGVLDDTTYAKESELHQKEKDFYEETKEDTEKAVAGCTQAIQIIRDYYGDVSTGGTDVSSTIIELLQLIITDLEKSLAQEAAYEEVSAGDLQKSEEERAIAKLAYEKDQKYKAQEKTRILQKVEEATADRDAAQTALDEAHEEYDKIKAMCVTASDQFEERIAKMKKEVEGLENALAILRGKDTALLQVGTKDSIKRSLRGVFRH